MYSFFLDDPHCLNCMCHWHVQFRHLGITQKKEYNIHKHGKSLKWRIIHLLWGGNCKKYSVIQKKLWINKTTLLTSLPFLLDCKDHDTIHHFLQFCHFIHSHTAYRIYKCTSCALLWERVHHNRQELDNISWEMLNIHLRLGSLLS